MRSTRLATVFDALSEEPHVVHDPGGLQVTVRVPVDAAAEVLAGHYPGFPILPGVLTLDCLQQIIDVVHGAEVRLAAVDRLRLLSPLLPGDELRLDVTVSPSLAVRARGRRGDGETAVDLRGRLEPVTVGSGGSGRSGGDADATEVRAADPAVTGASSLDQARVRQLLRQRHPMLLLDRVAAVAPGASIVASKAVTVTEPCYAHVGDAGSFAYPAALLVESFGQAVGVLWTLSGFGEDGAVPLLASLRDVTFGAPAEPGAVLSHQVRLEQQASGSTTFAGRTCSASLEVLRVGAMIVVSRTEVDLTVR